MDKPHSAAAERNSAPILEILQTLFPGPIPARVLEIGSGTGQHAVYFSRALPHLDWQPSDLTVNHAAIRAWLADAGFENLRAPIAFDVNDPPALGRYHGVFSANTAHIMSWAETQKMIAVASGLLHEGGRFVLYGPFNVGGAYTSPSNRDFDAMLRRRDPQQGIRNREDVAWAADRNGLSLIAALAMPANNQTLVFEKRAFV